MVKLKLKDNHKNQALDREIPFTITLIALLAGSGISPFESFRKLKDTDLLPATKEQSHNIVHKVEVLGEDPLSVIQSSATGSGSVAFQSLLTGYVSTVRTGGSISNYLKSKLHSAFELQAALAKQSIEKLGMVVDAYMSILVIALSSFSMIVSMSSVDIPIGNLPPIEVINLVMLAAIPIISLLFIYVAHTMRHSSIVGIDKMFRTTLFPIIGLFVALIAINYIPDISNLVRQYIGIQYLLLVGLIAVSFPPMIKYERMARLNTSAERAMPIFIRNVVESRKTGLSPVKCVIQACEGENFGIFSKYLTSIADQLRWGLPLRRVFSNISDEIKSWPVLVNIFILLEVIETGGGFSDSLEDLAESSEKMQNMEAETRDMLQPYIILPMIVTALLSFTTIILISSFVSLSTTPAGVINQMMEILTFTIILQSWLTGFFLGKVTSGAFAAGFKYGILLSLIAAASIFMTSNLGINLGGSVVGV